MKAIIVETRSKAIRTTDYKMASNILSRLLPSTSPSIYEAIRREEEDDSNSIDLEAGSGTAIDEENLGRRNLRLDFDQVDEMENRIRLEGSPASTRSKGSSSQERPPKWQQLSRVQDVDEANDEVPASLLVELDQPGRPTSRPRPPATSQPQQADAVPVVGRASGATRARWNSVQQQQRLYRDPNVLPAYAGRPDRAKKQNNLLVNPRERALWRWANVQNLDNFLHDVYQYYLGKGIYSMLLSQALNLL